MRSEGRNLLPGWQCRILALAGLFLGPTAPLARAGIYNLEEPPSVYVPPYKQVRQPADPQKVNEQVAKITTIDDNVTRVVEAREGKPTALRKAYLELETDLRQRLQKRSLTTAETVSLTACLLRRGRHGDAFAILEKALASCPPTDPGRFLLLLHQAAAYDRDPELKQRALDVQEQALKSWPSAWPGWSKSELDWYYRAEKYEWELMKIRQRQAFPGPLGEQRRASVDALFPRVHFVSMPAIGTDVLSIATAWGLAGLAPSGSSIVAGPLAALGASGAAMIVAADVTGGYEAGRISPAQMAELPVEAEAIVVQLLIWHPGDIRLRWLYGEMLNTRGEVENAFNQLDRCRQEGLSLNAEVQRHCRVLGEAVRRLKSNPPKETVVLPPIIPPSSTPTPAAPLPEWQVLGTGLLVGVFLTLLGVFQVQQWQRRKARLPS
jgi:hypothetical protein